MSASDITTTTTVTSGEATADLVTSTKVTIPPDIKPGWRTSEFWLKLAAALLTFLYASGALTNDRVLQLAGIAATVLTALGYTVSRTMIKAAGKVGAVALLVIAASVPQLACSSSAARAVGRVAWDCTEPQRAKAVAVLTPLADSAIRAAASADGSLLDASLLRAALGTANLRSEVGSILVCAAAEAFAALVRAPAGPGVGAAGLVVSPEAAQAAFDRLRAEQFPGTRITTSRGAL